MLVSNIAGLVVGAAIGGVEMRYVHRYAMPLVIIAVGCDILDEIHGSKHTPGPMGHRVHFEKEPAEIARGVGVGLVLAAAVMIIGQIVADVNRALTAVG